MKVLPLWWLPRMAETQYRASPHAGNAWILLREDLRRCKPVKDMAQAFSTIYTLVRSMVVEEQPDFQTILI